MSRNGSGTYSPPTNSWNPATDGTPATASDWQAVLTDLSNALTQSVSKDGQTAMTGNLSMGGNKLTGLGAGVNTGDSLRFEQLFSQGQPTDIASAATCDIGAVNSTILNITGTTAITSFGVNYNGPRFVRFAGVLTLTHNATTLILPTGVNITTAAGDSAILVPNGSPASGWRVASYDRANGFPLAGMSTDYLNTTRIDVASATTVDLTTNAPNTRNINITGTTTITGFTVAVGLLYFVRFNAALTLTNGASLVTQTGANITTSAGDTCIIRATAANTIEVLSYSYAGIVPNASITPTKLSQPATLGTAVATTSGTSVDITGIPSWANEISIPLNAISTSGSSNLVLQLGATTVETSGYAGANIYMLAGSATQGSNHSAAFTLFINILSASVVQGVITLVRVSGNTWAFQSNLSRSGDAAVNISSGVKTLAGALDRVRLTTAGGTDTFDAGSYNVFYK